MTSSVNIRFSGPQPPVQSLLPLFEGAEYFLTDIDAASTVRPRKPNTDLTNSLSPQPPARPSRTDRSSPVKAVPGRDSLKQAQRVARQLRRGEFDRAARQAAVNSLCQHLIDSLQSPPSRIRH